MADKVIGSPEGVQPHQGGEGWQLSRARSWSWWNTGIVFLGLHPKCRSKQWWRPSPIWRDQKWFGLMDGLRLCCSGQLKINRQIHYQFSSAHKNHLSCWHLDVPRQLIQQIVLQHLTPSMQSSVWVRYFFAIPNFFRYRIRYLFWYNFFQYRIQYHKTNWKVSKQIPKPISNFTKPCLKQLYRQI